MLLTYISQVLSSLHYVFACITGLAGVLLFVNLIMGFSVTRPVFLTFKQIILLFTISCLLMVLTPANLLQQRDYYWRDSYFTMKENNQHHREQLEKANEQISQFNEYLTKYNRTSEWTEFYNTLK